MEVGLIHGIPFINKETGEFIELTTEDKRFIKEQDILQNVNLALSSGWNTKLQERGLSWETIPDKYKLPLEDLAYNVGGRKAGESWTKIFDDVQNDNIAGFVKNLRRQDAGKNTAGMDNRAAKAAAASGLITSYQQALDYGLELTTERRLPFLNNMFEREQYGVGGFASKLAQRLLKKAAKKEEVVEDLGYYSKVPEGSSSDNLTRSFLNDFGFNDLRLEGLNSPPKNSTSNFFIDQGNNKYVLYIHDGKKHKQKTFNNATVEELQDYFGF